MLWVPVELKWSRQAQIVCLGLLPPCAALPCAPRADMLRR